LCEVKKELGIVLKPEYGKMLKRFIAWGKAIIDIWLFKQDIDVIVQNVCCRSQIVIRFIYLNI